VIQGALERREELLLAAHQEGNRLKRRLVETAKAQIDQYLSDEIESSRKERGNRKRRDASAAVRSSILIGCAASS
jgi:hypothetical protein